MEIKSINARLLIGKRLLMTIMKTFIFLMCTTVFCLTPDYSFSQEKIIIEKDSKKQEFGIGDTISYSDGHHWFEKYKIKEIKNDKVRFIRTTQIIQAYKNRNDKWQDEIIIYEYNNLN